PRVGVEHFEITRCAALVSDRRQPQRLCGRARQQLLLFTELAVLPICDQCVGHITQRLPNGLLIREQRYVAPYLGQLQLRSRATGREHRLEQRRADREERRWPRQERR